MTIASHKNAGNVGKSPVFNLGNEAAYSQWRQAKLANYPVLRDESIVTVEDMAAPKRQELSQIINLCLNCNMAIYQSDGPILSDTLAKFCRKLGLITMEGHRSAAGNGVVSIEQTAKDSRGGYIPYTNKPLSWHTDGYYNAEDDRIRAMVLHCERDAAQGGVNQLFDPEIAYIRLRDENPDFIAAFLHEDAMMIPANTDPRTPIRPDSPGPVFSVDRQGHLHMRYSARARNIVWANDKATDGARAFLTHILENDPLVLTHKLQSGQGVISNNVLHDRTGFVDASDHKATRLLYRIRYKERVAASLSAANQQT
jgi:alpha-ketoglutarate-dependent taurine dioxygenase